VCHLNAGATDCVDDMMDAIFQKTSPSWLFASPIFCRDSIIFTEFEKMVAV
jgi:hypothetical protein